MSDQLELDNIAPILPTVKVGDALYELKYDLLAIRNLLKTHGSLGQVFKTIEAMASAEGMATFDDKALDLFADLIRVGISHDANITTEAVLKSMNLGTMPSYANAVATAFTAQLPSASKNPQ